MNLFEKYFIRTISEDNVSGAGGVFGDTGSTSMFPGGGGSYADGDARIPTLLGSRANLKNTKKRRKSKRKKKRVKKEQLSIARRNLNNTL